MKSILDKLLTSRSIAAAKQSNVISTKFQSGRQHNSLNNLKRRLSPISVLEARFMNAADLANQHILLRFIYDPKEKFVGADIWRAAVLKEIKPTTNKSVDNKFALLTTLPLSQSQNILSYKDYVVDGKNIYYYYVVCFDDRARLSSRSIVVNAQKVLNNIVQLPQKTLQAKKAFIDKSTGLINVPFAFKRAFAQGIKPKCITLVDDDGKEVGRSFDMTSPLICKGLKGLKSVKGLSIVFKDKNDKVITLNGEAHAAQLDIDIDIYQTDIGIIDIIPDYISNRIVMQISKSKLKDVVKYVMVLRRNLTIGENSYSIPDAKWKYSGFFVTDDDIILYDTNVLTNDIYEYKIKGYDLSGNLLGAYIKSVSLKPKGDKLIASKVKMEALQIKAEPLQGTIATPTPIIKKEILIKTAVPIVKKTSGFTLTTKAK